MIAAYLRVSGKSQANRETIGNQRRAIEEDRARKGLPPIDIWFVDDATTSRIPLFDRPGGRKLQELAQSGKLRELIVYMYDRLGRDEEDVDTLVAMATLRRMKVLVTSLKEPNSDSKLGLVLASMGILHAGIEKSNFRERTADGRRR